jgi:hypothetical protein
MDFNKTFVFYSSSIIYLLDYILSKNIYMFNKAWAMLLQHLYLILYYGKILYSKDLEF